MNTLGIRVSNVRETKLKPLQYTVFTGFWKTLRSINVNDLIIPYRRFNG